MLAATTRTADLWHLVRFRYDRLLVRSSGRMRRQQQTTSALSSLRSVCLVASLPSSSAFARGDFVVVKLDMSNGFNAVSRSVLLRRLGEVPALAHWVPFLHALSGPGSDLLLGRLAMRLFEGELRADSSEGTQQGLPPHRRWP